MENMTGLILAASGIGLLGLFIRYRDFVYYLMGLEASRRGQPKKTGTKGKEKDGPKNH